MRRFPNSSIISIITRDNGKDVFDVLYINTIAVPDIFEGDEVFWYPGNGKLGKASLVWGKLYIRQWVAHSNDLAISQLYDHILLEKSMKIGEHKIDFKFPIFIKQIVSPNPYFNRNQNDITQLVTTDLQYFPQDFLIKENLSILCGYKLPTKDIHPFFPLGFYEKNYLFTRFTEGVLGEKHERIPYLTFHGIANANSPKREISSMTGFYQEDFKEGDNFTAKFKDGSGNENGSSIIDHRNGVFSSVTAEGSGTGGIIIERNASAIRSLEYTLIKDIQFNVDMANGNITDAYGDQHLIVPKSRLRPVNFSPGTWHKSVFSSTIDGNKALSQKFQDMLNYMGPNLLIVDPYYINNIKYDSVQKKPILTDCQISLLNALSVCAITTGIDEINFLGYNARANNYFDKDSEKLETTNEQRFIRYGELIRGFILASGLTSYLKPGSVNFINAPKDFHNRYWFSISEDKKRLEKCVIVKNSIGNMTEVDFIEVTDVTQLRQITSKYFNLFKTATNELTV